MATQRDNTASRAGGGSSRTNPRDNQPRVGRGSQGRWQMPGGWWWLWFALLLLLNFLAVSYFFPSPEAPVEVPYTLFKEQVEADNVEEISSRGDAVEGTFEEPVSYPPEGENGSRTSTRFNTALPSFTGPALDRPLRVAVEACRGAGGWSWGCPHEPR